MKSSLISAALALLLASSSIYAQTSQDNRSTQEILFEDGNYAMFIHFGLYSKFEGEWKGKAYYGNAEWLMNGSQAGIPVNEYMAEAATFNPVNFNAKEIVDLAKAAGMKYIVITSKHHEGFAMFDSEADDFNIVDATPFKRDVIGELAEECHKNGLGIGFYYSQWQDWTAPGGNGGPSVDADGKEVSFKEFFKTKCLPQVEEITTKYGEIELIWFDTPGEIEKSSSEDLVAMVKKNQPHALISSRVGNGVGDYESLGDMEVPLSNIDGRWESIDVTQTSWGYSRENKEWKTPEYIVRNLFSTIARGGTYMMNIGPKADGSIDEMASWALRKAGEWVHKFPQAVYGAGASPWGHALPWGDAVTQEGKIILAVYNWPEDGRLWLPGLESDIRKIRFADGKKLKFKREGSWTCIKVPAVRPSEIAPVIEVYVKGEIKADKTMAATPGQTSRVPVDFAEISGCERKKSEWMEKFGEWKFTTNAFNFTPDSYIEWTVDFAEAGYYDVQLEYLGSGLVEWGITVDGGKTLRNSQGSTSVYAPHDIGWIKIEEPGVHTFRTKVLNGDTSKLRLSTIIFKGLGK